MTPRALLAAAIAAGAQGAAYLPPEEYVNTLGGTRSKYDISRGGCSVISMTGVMWPIRVDVWTVSPPPCDFNRRARAALLTRAPRPTHPRGSVS
jgi:hypothetical protein